MGQAGIENPELKAAYFHDFSGEKDHAHYLNLREALERPRYRALFNQVGATAYAGFSEDMIPQIVLASLSELTDEQKVKLQTEIPWDIAYRVYPNLTTPPQA